MESNNSSEAGPPSRPSLKDRIKSSVGRVFTQTEQSPRKEKKLTRREFLGLALTTAVAVPVAVSQIEKAILDGLTTVLTSPGSTDRVISAARTASEVDRSEENPNARPMYELVRSGIANYEGKTGKKALYRRSTDYKDKEYYSEVLNKISRSILLPKNSDDILEEFKDSIPGDAKLAYFSSDLRITQFEWVFAQGSGFYERFKQRHPDLVRNYDKVFAVMEKEGKEEIDEARRFVEQRREELGKSISSSEVLEYFLGKNEGDIAISISDTAIFLKFMARSDPKTAKASYTSFNEDWFQTNIMDEYRGPSYSEPSKDGSTTNLIGKPYHSWNLVALLPFFPVELIHVAGIYRQLSTLKDQGISKTKSDLQTLKDLSATEAVCLKYQ